MSRPTHGTWSSTETAFRLIVFKRLRQGSLFPEEGQRYPVVARNREEEAEQTLDGYHQRGEHSENRIKELKLDFGMERMPCGQFRANALFFAVGVLAYNLYKLFVNMALPKAWRARRAGSLRYALYAVAGKVANTGGQILLRVSRSAYDFFAQIRKAVARMESG